MVDEYSTTGRTRALYAISLNARFCVLMFLLWKPNDRLAEVVMLWMWLLNDRFLLISTPRYLEPATDSKTWPCSRYLLGIGALDLVTCITIHLPGLNSVSHSNSHLLRWQNLSIFQAGDCQVNGRVISKQPYLRLCWIGYVIYIYDR